MNRLLLLTVTVLTFMQHSVATLAERVAFEEPYEGDNISVRFASMEVQGNYIQYWQLVDLHKKLGNIASISEQIKLNCSGEIKKYQKLQLATYAKPEGNDLISNEEIADPIWKYAAPESVYEKTFQRLCESSDLLQRYSLSP